MTSRSSYLGIWLHTGTNEHAVPLERFENGRWIPSTVDGEPVLWPVKLEGLPPGRY